MHLAETFAEKSLGTSLSGNSSQRVFLCYLCHRQGFVRREQHDVPPRLVDSLEQLGCCWQLSDNVWRPEDGLEVHPCALAGLPLVKGFLA